MSAWQTSEWLTFWGIVVAVIIGVLAMVITVRVSRRRRGKLLVAHTSTILLTEGVSSSFLKVTYRDIPVQNPHLVTLLVKNIGPDDITSEHFHGGEPLVVSVKGTWYGIIETESTKGTKFSVLTDPIGDKNATVRFPPAHLPKGGEWRLKFIVSGPAIPEISGSLVNVDIVQGETTSSAVLRVLGEATLGLPGVIGISTSIFEALTESVRALFFGRRGG